MIFKRKFWVIEYNPVLAWFVNNNFLERVKCFQVIENFMFLYEINFFFLSLQHSSNYPILAENTIHYYFWVWNARAKKYTKVKGYKLINPVVIGFFTNIECILLRLWKSLIVIMDPKVSKNNLKNVRIYDVLRKM